MKKADFASAKKDIKAMIVQLDMLKMENLLTGMLFALKVGQDQNVMKESVRIIAIRTETVLMELVSAIMDLMENIANFVLAKMIVMEKENAKMEIVYAIKATGELIVLKDM